MVNFLYTGKISCDNPTLGSKTCKNLKTMFGLPISIVENQLGKSQLVTDIDSESNSRKCDNSDMSPLTHEGSDTLTSDVPLLKPIQKSMNNEKENSLSTKSLGFGQEDYIIKIKDDNDIIMVSFFIL